MPFTFRPSWAAVAPLIFLLLASAIAADRRVMPTRSRTAPAEPSPPNQPSAGGRVSQGLIAYYPFARGEGSFAQDQSGFGGAMDLAFGEGVSWLAGRNGVVLADRGKLQADSAAKVGQAIGESGEFSVEVFLKAANTEQDGPARIVTYSPDPWHRNFMFAADGPSLNLRLRTTETDENGNPDLVFEGEASTDPEHYVVTFAEEQVKLYRNGALAATVEREGDLSNWDESLPFVVGNEATNNRPWSGEIYLVALYSRALSELEVRRNLEIGSNPAEGSIENRPPAIRTGGDQMIVMPKTSLLLPAEVDDEGLPNNTVTVGWRAVSGPGEVSFSNPSAATTTASFSQAGSYELELEASDGELTSRETVTVEVVRTARVDATLMALYPFSEGSGAVAKDHSASDPLVPLTLGEGASWLPDSNGVRLTAESAIQAENAGKLHSAIVGGNQFTFETWVRPESVTQADAMIFGIIESHYQNNLRIQQDREGLQVRLRTTESDNNGRPLLRAPAVFDSSAHHIAVTFDGRRLTIYVDGEEARSAIRYGDLSAWAPEFPVRIGADSRGRYGFAGEIYLTALYSRALSAPEVRRNYLVGASLAGGGFAPPNSAPLVDAGRDRLITLPRNAIQLRPDAIDDGLPGAFFAQWSGPAEVQFDDANALGTTARFSAPGVYTLELEADDGELSSTDEIRVTVAPEWAPRLLEQATWGPTTESLERLIANGREAFFEEQFEAPSSSYPEMEYGNTRLLQELFYVNALRNPDQLRQRMAFALGQIVVVSANAVGRFDQMREYQLILLEHALGNYFDLLKAVTLSPTMGDFLDMVNNSAETPESLSPPNENYAREFLQLFSIGTVLLNPDGTPREEDAYDEETVRQFTKAFTGWTYPTRPDRSLDYPNKPYYEGPMEPVEEFHDHSEKRLLNGVILPAGRTAREDLDAALRNAFEHLNVGPFVSKQLIQHLVTSNPDPSYVERVAAVFADNGQGVRGDLKAVAQAILMDPDAQRASSFGGHLREPILYTAALMRNLGAEILPENDLADHPADMGQTLFFPPSVFNYFSPFYQIPGLSALGPEFQIHTKANALARANFIYTLVDGFIGYGTSLDFSRFEALAEEPDDLVDAIDEALFQGRMTEKLRGACLRAARGTEDYELRFRNALYVAATSSEYQVQH